ncbi:transposase [Streptomyces sp. NPDC127079]|uniref:transposase n=1 Tax=Streptomyces sp. NPDC127079 TaxID=3347132 RepID=UPI0036461593
MEFTEADAELCALITHTAPGLLGLPGVGTETAGQRLVTAGDNDRLAAEASFAHRCAAAPAPASSGRTDRHRLNRGGDRRADRALHTIVLVRMRHDPRTRAYVARRTLEGLKTKDMCRCLKRCAAREVSAASPAHHRHLRPLDVYRSLRVMLAPKRRGQVACSRCGIHPRNYVCDERWMLWYDDNFQLQTYRPC